RCVPPFVYARCKCARSGKSRRSFASRRVAVRVCIPNRSVASRNGIHRWHGGHMRSQTITSLIRFARSRLFVPASLTVAALGLVPCPPASSDPPPVVNAAERTVTPGKRRDQVVDVYDRVKPAVVNIHSERTVTPPADDPFNRTVQPQRVNGMGTGIVL